MKRSPAAAALDSIVAEVLAPDLKSMGFRKKSRHWSHEAGETHRGVTVQSSQFNVTSDSRFTVEIGASFVALGHPVPNAPGAWGTAVSRRLSGLRSEPIDEWFAFDALDEATIERAGADLGRTWAQLGRPFLTALQSPQALCDFACDTGSAELALEVLDRVGVPLGDESRQSQLARIAADRAASRERWRHLQNDPHPLELGIGVWAEVVRQFHRLGLQLGRASAKRHSGTRRCQERNADDPIPFGARRGGRSGFGGCAEGLTLRANSRRRDRSSTGGRRDGRPLRRCHFHGPKVIPRDTGPCTAVIC